MNIKPQYKVAGNKVQIISGFSNYEIINRDGITICGNVRHIDRIRRIAIAKLAKA